MEAESFQYVRRNRAAFLCNYEINIANIHLGKISGGPDQDPDFDHHKKEIKAFLDTAARKAKRLPKKLRKKALDRIRQIADEADILLEAE